MSNSLSTSMPRIDLEGIARLVFAYDTDDDIAFVHLDGPRRARTEQADDSWYLRINQGELVGLELHGLRRSLLTTPLFSAAFAPAFDEMEHFAGRSVLTGHGQFRADGSVQQLPRTTHLVMLLLGQALARYERALRDELMEPGALG